MTTKIVYTIGHSSHSLSDLIDVLIKLKIESLIDIRRSPKSIKNPQFNSDTFPTILYEQTKMNYFFKGDAFGGRRKRKKSLMDNNGLIDSELRAYADHMQTSNFIYSFNELLSLISSQNCLLMCSESDVNECHRSLLSDYLLLKGVDIIHIILTDKNISTFKHILNPIARLTNDKCIYPLNDDQFKKNINEI